MTMRIRFSTSYVDADVACCCVRRSRGRDATIIAVAGQAMPIYWLGLMLIIVFSTMLVLLNLAVDVLYRWVDPRIE